MQPDTYVHALRILQGVDHQMLSRYALHQRGVADATIDAAIARGDVCGGPNTFSSIILTVDGEQFLASLPVT